MEATTTSPGHAASDPLMEELSIAVLLPCHNEEHAIAKVIRDFKTALPEARMFVYDNCSTDNTSAIAEQAGAVVRREPWPGKGNVVRRMFADIDADIYVMADGDGTYDASAAPEMTRLLVKEHLDMVVGTRRGVYETAHRRGHGWGNMLFNKIYRSLFGPMFTDIFSGYRVFSRRFVKSFPAISEGFEIETEISVHASQIRIPTAEVPTEYGKREEGSSSKLRTFRDAFRIFLTIARLFKEIKPARFYGLISIVLAASAIVLSLPLLPTYLETGQVPRFPTAILATGLMLMAAISLGGGLLLESAANGRLEQKRLFYLSMPQLGKHNK